MKTSVDQLDLFAESEAAELAEALAGPVRKLYALPPCGFHARLEAFRKWCAQYGEFDCFAISHGWHHGFTHPGGRTDTHQPTILIATLRCDHTDRGCECVGGLVARGACLHCPWEGDIRSTENEGVEDAHDHAWPGWRDLPPAPRPPMRTTNKRDVAKYAEWVAAVNTAYPAGWLESGGPIRTERAGGHRHVPLATGFGGYDLAVIR